jgi:hypothetical protein
MEIKKTVFKWVKEHKKELIFSGVTVMGTILVVKNWNSIKGIFKGTKKIATTAAKVEPVIEKVPIPNVSNDILENLTGNKLTATELGNKIWYSAQAINKRIVAAGLATKLPGGGYSLTEVGRLVGEPTWKTTWAGYSFSNIEWDEKVLEIIFSVEELQEISNKQKIAQEIFNTHAA